MVGFAGAKGLDGKVMKNARAKLGEKYQTMSITFELFFTVQVSPEILEPCGDSSVHRTVRCMLRCPRYVPLLNNSVTLEGTLTCGLA
jgi:hypothetical protein